MGNDPNIWGQYPLRTFEHDVAEKLRQGNRYLEELRDSAKTELVQFQVSLLPSDPMHVEVASAINDLDQSVWDASAMTVKAIGRSTRILSGSIDKAATGIIDVIEDEMAETRGFFGSELSRTRESFAAEQSETRREIRRSSNEIANTLAYQGRQTRRAMDENALRVAGQIYEMSVLMSDRFEDLIEVQQDIHGLMLDPMVNTARQLTVQGLHWFYNEELNLAEPLLLKSLEHDNIAFLPYYHLGHIRCAKKDFPQAARYFELAYKCATNRPDQVRSLFAWAKVYHSIGNVVKAAELAKKLAHLEESISVNWFLAASYAAQAGESIDVVWSLLRRAIILYRLHGAMALARSAFKPYRDELFERLKDHQADVMWGNRNAEIARSYAEAKHQLELEGKALMAARAEGRRARWAIADCESRDWLQAEVCAWEHLAEELRELEAELDDILRRFASKEETLDCLILELCDRYQNCRSSIAFESDELWRAAGLRPTRVAFLHEGVSKRFIDTRAARHAIAREKLRQKVLTQIMAKDSERAAWVDEVQGELRLAEDQGRLLQNSLPLIGDRDRWRRKEFPWSRIPHLWMNTNAKVLRTVCLLREGWMEIKAGYEQWLRHDCLLLDWSVQRAARYVVWRHKGRVEALTQLEQDYKLIRDRIEAQTDAELARREGTLSE